MNKKELTKYGIAEIDDKSIELEYQQLIKSMGLDNNNDDKQNEDIYGYSSVDLGFTEKDMDDPALAAALEAAGIVTNKETKSVKYSEPGTLLGKDFEDEDLVSELKQLGIVIDIKNNNSPAEQRIKTTKKRHQIENSAQTKSKNIFTLEQEMNEYKTKALQYKKKGDITSAKQFYNRYKVLKVEFEKRQQQHNETRENVRGKIHEATSVTAENEIDIDNVEVNEDDMVDPALLHELKLMGYTNEKEEKKKVRKTMKKTIMNNEVTTSCLQVEKEMNEYKTMALNAKANGDIPSAKEYYKQYKLLKGKFEKQQEGKKQKQMKVTQKKSIHVSRSEETSNVVKTSKQVSDLPPPSK